CGLGTPEYLVDVFGGPPENGFKIGTIGQKPPNLWKNPEGIHRRQSIARRKFDDRFTVVDQQAIRKDDETPAGLFAAILDCVLNLCRIADRSNANRDLLGITGCRNDPYKLCSIVVGGICYERDMRNRGVELCQQL